MSSIYLAKWDDIYLKSMCQDTEKYIIQSLDPILEELIADVIHDHPEDPLDFMISWLRRRCGASAGHARPAIMSHLLWGPSQISLFSFFLPLARHCCLHTHCPPCQHPPALPA